MPVATVAQAAPTALCAGGVNGTGGSNKDNDSNTKSTSAAKKTTISLPMTTMLTMLFDQLHHHPLVLMIMELPQLLLPTASSFSPRLRRATLPMTRVRRRPGPRVT